METINAREAKQGFGDVLMKAQNAPVAINKNGKHVAVVVSAVQFAEMQASMQELLHKRLDEAMLAVEEGRVVDGPEFMEEMRKKHFNGNI